MTRLVDQLHKESTPDEQALTLQMLSGEMQKRILVELGVLDLKQELDSSMFICFGGQPWCKLPPREIIAFRWKKQCCYGCRFFVQPPEEPCERCDYLRFDSKSDLERCGLKPVSREETKVYLKLSRITLDSKYELEKICKRGDFIIGYIDIYFQIDWTMFYDVEVAPSFVVRDFPFKEGSCNIIVECKPELKTFQGVLRQIKTYREVMRRENPYAVIATYSKVSDEVRRVLRSQGVYVVSVEKPVSMDEGTEGGETG